MWDSITGFFSDIGSFFSGEMFFELAGDVWNGLMVTALEVLGKNPSSGTYAGTWTVINNIYNAVSAIAASLLVVFFLWGFLRDTADVHSELSLDRTIRMFIRLILTANAVTLGFSWMPKILSWGVSLTNAISNSGSFGFLLDGKEIYESISESDFGAMVAFLTSFLFFLFVVVCGFAVVLTVLKRVINIYLLAPFCAVALSTLAGGGQISQVGFSYIRSFLGYVFSACLIAVVIAISGTFINAFTIDDAGAVTKLVECCVKVGAVATAVKSSDQIMQKAFNL